MMIAWWWHRFRFHFDCYRWCGRRRRAIRNSQMRQTIQRNRNGTHSISMGSIILCGLFFFFFFFSNFTFNANQFEIELNRINNVCAHFVWCKLLIFWWFQLDKLITSVMTSVELIEKSWAPNELNAGYGSPVMPGVCNATTGVMTGVFMDDCCRC